ncbi:hypothetical protein C8F04DRAFT_1245411 [Mycena alexandri]|uniref:Uncharacterized protein n=1 Tax=Mycena alexandri TaxID=1745969 RepID=A0AAD6RVY2_9AGAR|nr:hypothetical protein C8F04DRAFT_1245411 [Mycena alexandri]
MTHIGHPPFGTLTRFAGMAINDTVMGTQNVILEGWTSSDCTKLGPVVPCHRRRGGVKYRRDYGSQRFRHPIILLLVAVVFILTQTWFTVEFKHTPSEKLAHYFILLSTFGPHILGGQERNESKRIIEHTLSEANSLIWRSRRGALTSILRLNSHHFLYNWYSIRKLQCWPVSLLLAVWFIGPLIIPTLRLRLLGISSTHDESGPGDPGLTFQGISSHQVTCSMAQHYVWLESSQAVLGRQFYKGNRWFVWLENECR